MSSPWVRGNLAQTSTLLFFSGLTWLVGLFTSNLKDTWLDLARVAACSGSGITFKGRARLAFSQKNTKGGCTPWLPSKTYYCSLCSSLFQLFSFHNAAASEITSCSCTRAVSLYFYLCCRSQYDFNSQFVIFFPLSTLLQSLDSPSLAWLNCCHPISFSLKLYLFRILNLCVLLSSVYLFILAFSSSILKILSSS